MSGRLVRWLFHRVAALACVPASVPARLKLACTGQYRIPVLVYHTITGDEPSARRLAGGQSVAEFEAQMRWLVEAGFQPISIEAYWACVEQRTPFPVRSILITFDDGYRSVYTRAFPILQRHAFPAVVFVVGGYVGADGRFPADEKYGDLPPETHDELRPLSWEELRAMCPLVAVGSHTTNHVHLATLATPDMERELSESKRQIEATLGTPCPWFAYPWGTHATGDVSERTRRAVLDTGYRLAFINEIGRNAPTTDPFEQDRIAMYGRQSRACFLSKLYGGYDWVGTVYRIVRGRGTPQPRPQAPV